MNGFHLIIDHDMKRDISNKILQDRMETGPSKLAAYKKNSDKSKSNNL